MVLPYPLPHTFFLPWPNFRTLYVVASLWLPPLRTTRSPPSPPPSFTTTLNPDTVYTFDLLSAQQTPAGIYPLILYFSSSGPVVRMKCGKDGCRSTANPTDSLPITCGNTFTPHIHYKYDMIPCLFAVIPSHGAQDCSPKTPDGVPIPSPISILTPVSSIQC